MQLNVRGNPAQQGVTKVINIADTGRPASDEHSPYYGGYIDQVPEGDILTHLAGQIERTTRLLQGLSEEQAAFRPTPTDWSVKEVVCHISDSERIFAYRALRIARADPTPLAGFDQEPYVVAAEADARPIADLLAEFASVRDSTLWLFRSLPAVAWLRRGVASDAPVSVRALAYIIAGHENHHVRSLLTEYLTPAME
jgi:uncharacterized damage-inducible protein DinB